MATTTPEGAVARRLRRPGGARSVRALLPTLTFAAFAVASCRESSLILGDVDPNVDLSLAEIAIVGGDGQAGVVGSQVATPLSIEVTNSDGSARSGVSVEWTFTDGQGRPEPGTAAESDTVVMSTNPQGRASVRWRLGTQAGVQHASARIRLLIPTPTSAPSGASPSGAGEAPPVVEFAANVAPAAAATVSVDPVNVSVQANSTAQLNASARDTYGNAVTGTFSWQSSNTAVAQVSQTGLVTAVSTGSATVSATLGAASGGATVQVTGVQNPALSITTATVPAGVVGGAYSYSLSATGGTGSYSWSIVSGSLPSGIGLNGATLSGTPTNAQTADFSVRVASGGAIATRDLSMTVNTPAPPSVEFPNRPSGLTMIFDEKFETPWSGTCPAGWSGCAPWRPLNISTLTDATAPSFTGTGALRTALPAGTNGGVLTMAHAFGGSYDVLYVSYWVKWDPGYDHNGTSEKLLNFGDLGTTGALFQFHWGVEAIMDIAPGRPEDMVSGPHLHANLMPRRSGDGMFNAPPPPAGLWTHYEFLFERTAGRVRWWTNGLPRADHQGVSIPQLDIVYYNDTWGGGGSKGDSGGRISARLYLAGSM